MVVSDWIRIKLKRVFPLLVLNLKDEKLINMLLPDDALVVDSMYKIIP